MITEPTVRVLAQTQMRTDLAEFESDWFPGGEVEDIDHLHEVAGRACYQSWNRPNPATATNEGYLDHIADVGHWSVLAHGSITLYIEGVSRSLTHELVRSRFLAFSQLSQRYVNAEDMDWVCPVDYLGEDFDIDRMHMNQAWALAMARYYELCERGKARAWKPKRYRQAARAVLPNCAETKIVVSGNIRAWRDLLQQRLGEGAEPEIRRLASAIREVLDDIAPNSMHNLGV